MMKTSLILLSGLLIVTLAACEPAQVDGQVQPESKPSLKIIPWVEDNFAKYDAPVVEGLQIWQKVTDTAIVSTMPGRADLFASIHDGVPGMKIIPGLKTMNLLRRFDAVEGWEHVASEIRAIQSVTGSKIILLENEVAMKKYVDGEHKLNLQQLRKGLKKLPADLQYYWYPSIWGNGIKQSRNERVCKLVEEVLKGVRFLDQRYQGRRAVSDKSRINADHKLRKFIKNKTLPMQYFYGPDHPVVFWKDHDLAEALQLIRDHDHWKEDPQVVIYTGVKRWVTGARILTGKLDSMRNNPIQNKRKP